MSTVVKNKEQKYLLVDVDLLAAVFEECPKCTKKSCHVDVRLVGASGSICSKVGLSLNPVVLRVEFQCKICRMERRFDSSKRALTSAATSKEQLREVSLDLVAAVATNTYGHGVSGCSWT